MKILIAPDSYKGSLRSPAVAAAMAAGARRVFPEAEIDCCPVGDGGEGTLDALLVGAGGTVEQAEVMGPLGACRPARLGLLPDGETVYVEMAEASGLSCVPVKERDPLRSTSYGTGQLIARAFGTGRRRIVVGLGGSATNDGGAGLLAALGIRFLDKTGEPLPPGGAALSRLERIYLSDFRGTPEGVEIIAATDVTNPLCGPEGASAIYGPQKGASPEEVQRLEAALGRFARVAAETLGRDEQWTPGAGAAGGAGFALIAFLGARAMSGNGLVLDMLRLDTRVAGADLALTGEGRVDRQTIDFGKTAAGVGRRCRQARVPCVAFAGGIADDVGEFVAAGVDALVGVVPRPMGLEEAMARAAELIADGVERGLRLFALGAAAGELGRTHADGCGRHTAQRVD